MGALDCVSNDRIKSTDSTEVFTINMASSNSCISEPRRDLESQFSKSNCGDRQSIWWTLGIDIPLLVIVAVIAGLFEFGALPSHKGGFYCNDPKLSHTFTGDTVSMAVIILTILLLPLVVLYPIELLFLDTDYLQRGRWSQGLRNTLWLYRSYAYGLFFNFAVIEVMKMTTGMPRPTFFDICNPDAAKTCNGSEYVSKFTCTPSEKFSKWFQTDSYHSFPSGHTSLSVHCGLFLCWYLQKRAFSWNYRLIFVVPVLQAILLGYSLLCSLTRMTDHRHHWWDVLTGTVIGICTMLYSVLVLCSNFRDYSSKPHHIIDNRPTDLLYPRQQEIIS